MSGNREVLYYKVTPVFRQEGMAIGTACVATCMATGEYLSGQGGGGDFLKKEIVDALNMRKTGGTARVILDADTLARLVETGERLLRVDSNVHELSIEERNALKTLLDTVRA
jgi:hypothetical protein